MIIFSAGQVLSAASLNANFAETINTTGSYTFTGVHTHIANVVYGNTTGNIFVTFTNNTYITANGFVGSAGFVLAQDERGTYWRDPLTIVGELGPTGYTGSVGDVGYKGSEGFTGSKGIIGDRGDVGYFGSTGYQGSVGVLGPTGYIGSQGVQGVVGYTGSVGIIGPTGYRGSVGDKGDPGGPTGFTGSKGDQGIKGDKGDAGDPGADGADGAQGDIGYSGSRGAVGFTGSIGPTGSQGIKGDIGLDGPQGEQGALGYVGSIGFTGSRGETGYLGSYGYTGSAGYVGSAGNIVNLPNTQVVFIDNNRPAGNNRFVYYLSNTELVVGNTINYANVRNSYVSVTGDINAKRPSNITNSLTRTIRLHGATNFTSYEYGSINFVNYDSLKSTAEYIGSKITSANRLNGFANSAGDLEFWTGNRTLLSSRVLIAANGNVGIKTTSPHSTLTVAGNVHINETLRAMGNTNIGNGNITGVSWRPQFHAWGVSYFHDDIDLTNHIIYNVDSIRIQEPGLDEGINWSGGGNGWSIYELDNDEFVDNDNAGDLRIVRFWDGERGAPTTHAKFTEGGNTIFYGPLSTTDRFQAGPDGSYIFVSESGQVGINNNAPLHVLSVGGTIHGEYGLDILAGASIGGELTVGGNTFFYKDVTVKGDVILEGDITVNGNFTALGDLGAPGSDQCVLYNDNMTVNAASSILYNKNTNRLALSVTQVEAESTEFFINDLDVTGNVVVSADTTVNGILYANTLSHNGLQAIQGSNVDQIYVFTQNIELNFNWVSTQVVGNEIQTGSYLVQVSVGDGANTEIHTGYISWVSESSFNPLDISVQLVKASGDITGEDLFIRAYRDGIDPLPYLQITAGDYVAPADYNFKLRRLI